MQVETDQQYRNTPQLIGDTFCSPRCGCGCKLEAYKKAWEDARALNEQMGGDWEIRVWENMGWHYQLQKHPNPSHKFHDFILELSAHTWKGKTEYTAWVQFTPQFVVKNEDPQVALDEAIGQFNRHVDALVDARAIINGAG